MALEVALSTLLISAFTINGLVSLCIVRSSLHRFLKLTVELAILSPLLCVPALEPLATFLLQACTIAVGLHLYQTGVSWQENKRWLFLSRARLRFSLFAMLLGTGITAIFLAIVIRMPELNEQAWTSIGLMGTGSGALVLLALAASESGARWYFRWPGMLLGALVIAAPLAWFDSFVPSVIGWTDWPPDSDSILPISIPRPLTTWLCVAPLIALVLAIWLSASKIAASAQKGDPDSRGRLKQLATLSLVSTTLAITIPSATVLWKLLTPLPIPRDELPQPNAYDALSKLGQSVQASPFGQLTVNWSTAPEQQLAPAVSSIETEIASLRTTLNLPCRVPLEYSHEDPPLPLIASQRSLAEALAAAGRLAVMQDRPNEACQLFVDVIRLGFAVRSGGLAINALVGCACCGIGYDQLYEHRQEFSQQACRDASAELLSILEAADPTDSILQRERVWIQHVMGWHGHLQQFLLEAVGSPPLASYRQTLLAEQAAARLLAVELALRAYFLNRGDWPESLDDLVPDNLAKVPNDPFDESDKPLRYSKTDGGYLLYSLGENGTDERGTARYRWETDRGDLMLDKHFLSADEVTNGGTSP